MSHAKQLRFNGSKTVIVYLRGQASLPNAPRSRFAAARTAQAPVRSDLARVGATHIKSLTAIDAVVAKVSGAGARAIAHNPNVKRVIPDGIIHGPSVTRPAEPGAAHHDADAKAQPNAVTPPICGTAGTPELDPEALSAIHATPAENGTSDGRGVKVAYMADGIDPTNVDFQRNANFATASSPAGSAMLTEQDFTGDGTSAPTPGAEAFIDASSIAAQGNHTYDLHSFMVPANPLPAGCDIKIVGSAPGSTVLGLRVFAENNATTTSNFVEAIDYAVHHGVKVINQSFGGNYFPATTQDAVVQANRAAMAAGVTVVASTGDAGITSTIGSPSSDPKIISVAGSTTYREYEQDMFGGTNVPGANGQWVNDNVSGLSSGGFTQTDGITPDLLAPGDLNWAPCSANITQFTECTDDNGNPTNLLVSGGTSESSPLTAGAAADVISAYSSTHGGKSPSPALVKQILMSTTRDVGAPASQGGAGLLDVHAAIAAAKSMPGTTGTAAAGVLVSPNQAHATLKPGATSPRKVTVTNHGPASETVKLSTRALTKQVATESGSFCLQPGHPTTKCPANTGTFLRETGAKQVYQAVHFTVPANPTSNQTRLVFDSAYLNTGQNSVLKVALLEPDGTYAMYSNPQGFADFADTEVANPPAGTWTAILFTTKTDAAGGVFGTKGKIRWNASTYSYEPANKISPSTLTIPAGKSKSATLTLKAPAAAGDTDESVVVKSSTGTTTIPVSVRTVIPIKKSHGHFSGILTGGNGRDGTSQNNAYEFDVPKGVPSIHLAVALKNDPGDTVTAGLVDPNGQLTALNTNTTADNLGRPAQTKDVDLYAADPQPGRWHVLLEFADPITGRELTEPFKGSIAFNRGAVTSTLPTKGAAHLTRGKSHTFTVNVSNQGKAPQAYFLDPRLAKTTRFTVPNLAETKSGKVPLPLAADFSTEPAYIVPPEVRSLTGKVKADVPVTFDMYTGTSFDPDIAAGIKAPGVTTSVGTNSAQATLTEPQVTSGLWFLDPSEIGPYGASQAPAGKAKVSLTAKMQAFDPAVSSSTGNFWSQADGLTQSFDPQYVPQGDSSAISVKVKPTGKVGSTVHGVVYVDAVTLTSPFSNSANEVVAIPYSYTIKK